MPRIDHSNQENSMRVNHSSIGPVTRLFALLLSVGLIGGCSTAPSSEAGKEDLHTNVMVALQTMQREDPSLDHFLRNSYGHVIFPTVGKGGLIAGGAYGRGEVYEGNVMIGYADLTQATIGAQAGGQEFSELIVFESKEALERFKQNTLHFAANASAVALKSGAGDSAKYADGVAVFVRPTAGLMVEAAIGGQSFSYTAKQ
jgi:lipid-binding SYLF domain-containing protein